MKKLILVLIALSFVSCNRSNQYKKDQDYVRDDMPPSYYQSGKSPSEKLESLGQPKKRVVVLNFWNDTPVKQSDLGAFAADELRRGLHLTQRMILPTDIRTELQTSDFVHGDKVKVAQLVREGRRLGVGVIVIGRVTKIVFRQRGDDVGLLRQKQSLAAVDVEAKIFDVNTGREIMAAAKSAEASSNAMVALESGNLESQEFRAELSKLAVRNGMTAMVPEVIKAVEKMAWEGRIAKVSGTKVYLNSGRASGLVAGDILKVLSTGDDVYDPASGAFLGRTQGQLKGTLEVVDFIGPDAAVAELHTGGNVQIGDTVRLY
jgi:hypothetical protein